MRKPEARQITVTEEEIHLITDGLLDAADAREAAAGLAFPFMTPRQRSAMEDKRDVVRLLSSSLWHRWHAAERTQP